MTKRKGFTLVELLVAISILAVLMAILLPNLMGARDKAKDSQRIQDLSTLKNALRMYYDDRQTYEIPDESSNWISFNDGCTGGCLSALVTGGYLPSLEGIGYSYATINNGDGFRLWTELSASTGDNDTESQSKCGIADLDLVDGKFMVCAN